MQVRVTYKGIREDGVKGLWCGFKPDNIIITEEINILYPETGMQLRSKETNELYDSVILTNGIEQEDFEEVEVSEA